MGTALHLVVSGKTDVQPAVLLGKCSSHPLGRRLRGASEKLLRLSGIEPRQSNYFIAPADKQSRTADNEKFEGTNISAYKASMLPNVAETLILWSDK